MKDIVNNVSPLNNLEKSSFGHGYISAYDNGVAESRVALCKFPASDTQQKNTNCGGIQYEPQSVEALKASLKSALLMGKSTVRNLL